MPDKHAPPVNPWLQLVTLFGLFIGGGVAGLWVSYWAAPDSGVAADISVMLLPGAFVVGLLIWSGLDVLFAVANLIRGRARHHRPNLEINARSWFVPVSVAIAGVGGFVVGLIPGGQGVIVTVLAYAAAGLIHGVLVSRLAARGYLPAPHWF